ncbi:unnamed protein product [Miscanthus lutarioriparius]|uniref:Protein kinase domain-containing protein n=1 Tax=Miscanthus lutarioriparius TaxID=422564 RepID=A0A811PDN6_9POAL|nr:unnamed protein product [Miscanthus lutarioriparius]
MAANLPRLPVLLFIFLDVHVPSTHGDPPLPSTYDVSMCSESTWCGSVEIHYPNGLARTGARPPSPRVEIHYPFYLANATETIADYSGNIFSCGYTDLSISCKLEGQTWIPTIRLDGDDYTVENISYHYDHQTILLVDSDVLGGAGGDCPAVRHEHSSSYNDNLTFLFGCDRRGPVPPEFDAYKINCTQFKSPPGAGPGDSFVVIMIDEHDRYLEQELATNCGNTMVVSVPVRGDVLMAASYTKSNFTSGGYGDVLKRGFELEWSRITEDGCHLCEASNGQCAYSQHRDFLGCLCDGGKVGSPDCKHIVPATASTATASRTELEILAPACIIRQGCLQPRDPRSAFCTKSVLFSRERDSSGGLAACRAPRAEAVLPLFPSGTRTRMLNDRYLEQELATKCGNTMVVTVPVRGDVLMAASYNKSNFTSGGYGGVLKRGFELEWSRITEDGCHLCEASNGQCAYSQHREFLGCLCHRGKVGIPDCKHIASRSKRKTPIIVGIVAGTLSLLFLCLVILKFFSTSKDGLLPFKSKDEPRVESFLQKNEDLHPKRYTYADVKRMTKSFTVKLGQGGFGAVYGGKLYDGCQVAVKMLKDTKGDGEEFMNEVASISRTSHVNVVILLGFCIQGSKRALIYEYMPNGSLERYAFNSNMNRGNSLSWEKLFDSNWHG